MLFPFHRIKRVKFIYYDPRTNFSFQLATNFSFHPVRTLSNASWHCSTRNLNIATALKHVADNYEVFRDSEARETLDRGSLFAVRKKDRRFIGGECQRSADALKFSCRERNEIPVRSGRLIFTNLSRKMRTRPAGFIKFFDIWVKRDCASTYARVRCARRTNLNKNRRTSRRYWVRERQRQQAEEGFEWLV